MDDYLKKLQVLIDIKKYEEVIRLGKRALQDEPGEGRVMHYMALASYYLGKFDEALSLAEAASRSGTVTANLLCLTGEIHFAKKEYRRAKERAEAAIELEPGKAATFNLFTKICLETGDLKKAEEYVDHTLSLDPGNYFALNIKSLLLNNRGDDEGSRHYEELAMKENPNHTYGHQIRGTKAMIKGNWNEAVDSYKEARRLNPNNKVAHKQLRKIRIFNPELMGVLVSLLIMAGIILSISRIIYTEAKEYHWLLIFFNFLLGGRSFFPNIRMVSKGIRSRSWVVTSASHAFLKIWRFISVTASTVILLLIAYQALFSYDYFFILWGSMAFFWLSLLDVLLFNLVNDSLSRKGVYVLIAYLLLLMAFFRIPDALSWFIAKVLVMVLLLAAQLVCPSLLTKKAVTQGA